MWVNRVRHNHLVDELDRRTLALKNCEILSHKWYQALRESEKGIKRLVRKVNYLKQIIKNNGIEVHKSNATTGLQADKRAHSEADGGSEAPIKGE